ncbi:hypothetical protein JTB14_009118 [Gonioctena quinquepunctata]|nr:hypothetical protein JTB14_009118 [Gonioctena quinquepunctata]
MSITDCSNEPALHITAGNIVILTDTLDDKKTFHAAQMVAFQRGRLNLTFDDNGDLVAFSGQPELLVSSIPQDEDVLQLLEIYRPQVIEVNSIVVGSSKVTLDGNDKSCRSQECNFGNLLADALVLYKASVSPELWTEAPIGLVNGGGIRTTIEPSESQSITRGELLAAIPFGNLVITLNMNGSELMKSLEIGVRSNGETSGGEFLQVSGLQVVYDMSKPAFSRVVSAKARCGVCAIPSYEPIVPSKNYTIVTISFLTEGGDGHYVLYNAANRAKVTEDLNDIDTFVWYFEHYSPVYPEIQGRIRFMDKANKSSSTMIQSSGLTLVLLLVVFIKNSLL